jgi:hypothetical protein
LEVQNLSEVVRDWERASAPYQSRIDSSEQEDGLTVEAARAFVALQPVFLKCVFSYAMFFIATEHAYERLYSQLECANRLSGIHLKHKKKPKRSSTVEKIRKVRNLSIVHLASSKNGEIRSRSALSWQPLSWSRPDGDLWNIDRMEFGAFRSVAKAPDGKVLSQSEDIKLPGIPELHRECLNYLKQFDEICTEYLDSLNERLVRK